MNLNTNQSDRSQSYLVSLTETEGCLLQVFLQNGIAEINAQLTARACLLERICRNERDIARFRYKSGVLDEISLTQELDQIDTQGQEPLQYISDWALIKGHLIKISEKVACSFEARG